MRIYLAGVRDPRAKRVCSELGVRNYLLSFANQRAFGQNSDVLENPECRVMVDSGAFSVWNTGRKIDVKKYADFAHKLMAHARCELIFVNLDVIHEVRGNSGEEARQDREALCGDSSRRH